MRVLITPHPLITHKLTRLRDISTSGRNFRLLVDELVTLLAYEATRDIRVEPVTVQTPVAEAKGLQLSEPRPLVIPILRAGLGMLEGMLRLLPRAEVGFLGMVRDEETLVPTCYADRVPNHIDDREVFVLDPMLATGGSLIAAINLLLDRGAKRITAICLLATPEGVQAIDDAFRNRNVDVTIVAASLDQGLNEKGYIVPGLGDAGDRLFGAV